MTETKVIGNKLIFKGVFLVSVLYRTTGGQLASASSELPFSQIMEIDSASESVQVSMHLQITGRISRSTALTMRAASWL